MQKLAQSEPIRVRKKIFVVIDVLTFACDSRRVKSSQIVRSKDIHLDQHNRLLHYCVTDWHQGVATYPTKKSIKPFLPCVHCPAELRLDIHRLVYPDQVNYYR